MTKQELLHALIDIHVIQLGEFTLRCGEISPVYIDCRAIISYPQLLRAVSHALWECADSLNPSLLCGVPYTALSFANCISLDQNIPMLMYRKEAKDYGTKKQIEGKSKPGENCLIIEDVVTTGGSLLKVADALKKADLQVTDMVVLVDRQQSGQKALASAGYHLRSVFTLNELINA